MLIICRNQWFNTRWTTVVGPFSVCYESCSYLTILCKTSRTSQELINCHIIFIRTLIYWRWTTVDQLWWVNYQYRYVNHWPSCYASESSLKVHCTTMPRILDGINHSNRPFLWAMRRLECSMQVGLSRIFHQLTGPDASILGPVDMTTIHSVDLTGWSSF